MEKTNPNIKLTTRHWGLVDLALQQPDRYAVGYDEPHPELGDKVVRLDVQEAILRQQVAFYKHFEDLFPQDPPPSYPRDMALMDFLAIHWAWIELKVPEPLL